MGFLRSIKLTLLPCALGTLQAMIKALCAEAFSESSHRFRSDLEGICNFLVLPAGTVASLICLKQHLGIPALIGGCLAFANDELERGSFISA